MEPREWDRLAESYHDEVVSPLARGVQNPLFEKLHALSSRQKVLGDLGCGRGGLAQHVKGKFKEVHFIDFSPSMIEVARSRKCEAKHQYHVADLRDLSLFHGKFDVAVAVNSVLMPSVLDVNQALKEIWHTLKEEGVFFGVFPAMESILYQAYLIYDDQLESCKDEERAELRTRQILERRKYNFVTGKYDDGDQQKFFYKFELRMRLAKAGFRNVSIGKVKYPWGEERSDYEQFPEKPEMWDWFVSATK